jgi:hypothetical protein
MIFLRSLPAALLLAVGLTSPALGGEKPVRVAIGPFFAPVAATSLQPTAQALPELLTVELSRESRFQVLERERVQRLVAELDMSAAGLTSRRSVVRVGQVLACDWLVSGSLVQTGARTLAWTKVIEMHSGVVLDLEAVPVSGDSLAVTVSNITHFVAGAGRVRRPQGREFISLGRIMDQRPWLSASRDDWSRRMSAVIEQYGHRNGYGVVEQEAVTPLFEERRLAAAGGQADEPVPLQPAFWLVDGGCKWIEGKPDRLEIGLRVQRVGGREQIVTFTTPAGEPAEKALTEHLQNALADTNRVPAERAAKAEADLMTRRGEEIMNLRMPFMMEQRPGATNVERWMSDLARDVERYESTKENRRRAVATYERTLLLDPTNHEAKINLAWVLFASEQWDERERAKELLKQVVASNHPKWAPLASGQLGRMEQMLDIITKNEKRIIEKVDWLNLERMVVANPQDWEARCRLGILLTTADGGRMLGRAQQLLLEVMACGDETLAARAREKLPENTSPALAARVRYDAGVRLLQSEAVADRERAVRLLGDVTNGPAQDLAALARRMLPPPGVSIAEFRPKPVEVAQYGYYTPVLAGVAPKFTVAGGRGPDHIWAAAGATLYHHVRASNLFEVIDFDPGKPSPAPITVIRTDGRFVWLGTAGEGIVQLTEKGTLVRRIGAGEGLPGLFIRAIASFGDLLWIGFALDAQGDRGGFGRFDVEVGKFTSLTPAALLASGEEQPDGPPARPVTAIKNVTRRTLWTVTGSSLKRYDIDGDRWSQDLPFAPRSFSVEESFITATAPDGGLLVCPLPGNTWKPSRAIAALNSPSIIVSNEGRRTWLGGVGRIRHFDIDSGDVIGGFEFQGGETRWFFPWKLCNYFIADGPANGTSAMYYFLRPPMIGLHERE